MTFDFMLVLIIALFMSVAYGIIDAIQKKMTTGSWDKGYFIAVILYSLLVGFVTAWTGLIDMSMPFDQIVSVIQTVFAQYIMYLLLAHTFFDLIISTFFPESPAGLASRFIQPAQLMRYKR